MPNSLDSIEKNLRVIADIYPMSELTSFWDEIIYPEGSFFSSKQNEKNSSKLLVVSGPSRNGNHLIHSLLDNHPLLPSVPGEDSTANALLYQLAKDPKAGFTKLQSEGGVEYLLSLSGKGKENKWEKIFQELCESSGENSNTTTWSGMYYGQGNKSFIYDYQDTIIDINYPRFLGYFKDNQEKVSESKSLIDLILFYADAIPMLDPGYSINRNLKYSGMIFGSGMRGSLSWMLHHSDNIKVVAPMRSFDTYYYSFAKGFFGITEVRGDVLKEAWEHWWHKAVDYVLLKMQFPDKICMVNFETVIIDPRFVMREVCDFLDVPFHEACTVPTVLGHPTKGNSSKGQAEEVRAKVYKSPLETKLDKKYIPENYFPFWKMLTSIIV